MKKSIEKNIDLNWKPEHFHRRTGFHVACTQGHFEIVELLIKNAVEFKIDLNSKDEHGLTGAT